MTRLSSFIAPDVNTTSRFDYTATNGQTTFTGADDDGSVLLYQGGFIDVYLNGVRLIDGTDFTTTSDGDSIVLTSPAASGDILSIVAYGVFDLANHYTKTESDNRYLRPDTVEPTFTGTAALGIPTGTTAERPGTPSVGQLRFNADEQAFEGYDGSAWSSIGSGEKGTLTKTFVTGESASINLSDSVLVPVVSATKEVPQEDITNNDWDVASDGANYTLHDTAYNTTLTPIMGDAEDLFVILSDTGDASNIDPTSSNVVSIIDQGNFGTPDLNLFLGYVSNHNISDTYNFTADTKNVNNGSTGYFFSLPSFTFSQADYISGSGTASLSGLTVGVSLVYFITYDSDKSGSASPTPSGFTDIDSFSGTDANAAFVKIAYKIADSTSESVTISDDNHLSVLIEVTGTPVSSVSANDIKTTRIDEEGTSISATSHNITSSLSVLILGTGSFASTDVGKRIVGNGGEAVLTATDGSYELQTAFNDDSTIAAGDWSMFGLDVESGDAGLTLSGVSFGQGYNINNASYDSIFFDFSSQSAEARSFTFNSAGTKMYTFSNDQKVRQYSLSTAFDLTTASYDNVIFDVSTEVGAVSGLAFNTNGTKMYVVGGSTIFQYSLGTLFDLNTASYDSVSFDVSGQDGEAREVAFNTSGDKMYMIGSSSDSVYQYTLTTAFNIGTASYDSVSFDVSGQDSFPLGVSFSNDGTKMYVVGINTDSVYQYTLSTGFDLSSASFDNISVDVSSQGGLPQVVRFNSNGSKMYLLESGSNSVYQYTTGTFIYFIPTSTNHTAVTSTSTDTEFWTDINSMTADDSVNDGAVYYAVSTDDRTTWSIIDDTNGIRNIVRNNAGTWEYNSNTTYGSETWTSATENDEFYALEEAATVTVNRMDSTQLNAVSDANHYTLGNDLDLAITLFMADGGSTSPTSDGVAINYDAQVKNVGAILGADYEWEAPTNSIVRITSLADQNLKVRVV